MERLPPCASGHVSTKATPPPLTCATTPGEQESDDEGEQDNVAHSAQLLMDCIADMVAHEGVTRMQHMVQGGATLFPKDHPTVVRGRFPDDMGGGTPLPLPHFTSSNHAHAFHDTSRHREGSAAGLLRYVELCLLNEMTTMPYISNRNVRLGFS
jgi:hypothetical protein